MERQTEIAYELSATVPTASMQEERIVVLFWRCTVIDTETTYLLTEYRLAYSSTTFVCRIRTPNRKKASISGHLSVCSNWSGSSKSLLQRDTSPLVKSWLCTQFCYPRIFTTKDYTEPRDRYLSSASTIFVEGWFMSSKSSNEDSCSDCIHTSNTTI